MMSLKILEHKKNPLLKREEVRALFEHAGKPTPPRDEILPFLEKSLKAKKDTILIDKIFSIKGKGESRLKVFVYSRKDDIPKEKLEVIRRREGKGKKKGEKPAEGEAEKAGEAKPEEAKGEEKPEEKPEEKTAEVKEGKGEV
jgi:ribosomal protein S24E